MSLKRFSMLATVVLACTNIYWVFDTMRERKKLKGQLKEAQDRFSSQSTSGKKASNG